MDLLLEKLKVFQDDRFSFNPNAHEYNFGKKKLVSVTTFIANFYEKFDTEYHSKRIAEKRGVDVSVILKEWDDKRDASCILGTDVHKYIEEKFYPSPAVTREDFSDPETLRRIDKFDQLYETRLNKLTPVVQELRVFSTALGLAGTIDALFLKDGKLWILDWKTNGKFKTDSDRCYQKLKPPFHDCWENELNKYSIQLNLYKLILAEYGIHIEGCAIVYIPPSVEEPKIIKTKDFYGKLQSFFGVDYKTELQIWN